MPNPDNTVVSSKAEDALWAVGPIKDDAAGEVNCNEVASMQDGSLAQKGRARFDQAQLNQTICNQF